MSVTKDSTFAAVAGEKYKVAFQHALTNVFLVFSFYYWVWFS